MDQEPTVATPMDLLFNTLARLMHAKVEEKDKASLAGSAEVMRGLVEAWRAQGHYDPSLPVGPLKLPLVHALNRLKDVPVSWLAFFAEHAAESRIFQAQEGVDLGATMFDRAMAGHSSINSKALAWWIKNAPELPQAQTEAWMERLSKRKTSDNIYSSYGNAKTDEAQEYLRLLVDRGAGLRKEEPGRPQERWLRREVWWQNLDAQGRMQDLVRAPSGIERPLEQMLALGNPGGPFWAWRGLERKRDDDKAPHGRKKDLMDLWVLNPQPASAGERAVRLAVSIAKTDGVLDEMWERCDEPKPRKPDRREAMKQILSHRTPSGMNLLGWFVLRHSDYYNWHGVETPLHGQTREQALEDTVAPDGAGLLLQALRAHVGSGVGEFPGWSHGTLQPNAKSALSEQFKHALRGDEATHGELVNLLVDTLVCPVSSNFSHKLATFALDQGLLDGVYTDKLRQAVDISRLGQVAARAVQAEMNASAHRKSYYSSSNTSKTEATTLVKKILDDMSLQGCLLSMSARDWDTLFTEWELTAKKVSVLGNGFIEPFKKLLPELRGQGERLALAEQTQSAAPRQAGARPRL